MTSHSSSTYQSAMDYQQEQEIPHQPPPRYSPPGYFSEQIQTSHNELAIAPMYGEIYPTGPPRPLQKPIVVPQTTNMFYIRSFSPFARAYSPALAQLPDPITPDEFLEFIDGLNKAHMMHPFFQASFVSGGFVMAAPLLPVQIAGGAVQGISALASGAVTVVKTRKYLRKANETMFNPRGLVVKMMETKKMMAAVGATETKLKLPPLNDVDDLDPTNGQPGQMPEDPRMRRLRALEEYVSPLSFNVPAEQLPEQWLERKATGPSRWLNARKTRKLAEVRGKGLKQQQDRAGQLAGELAQVNAEVQELERLARAQELVEGQLLENAKGRPRHPTESSTENRQIDHELAASLARRNEIIEEIRRAGEGKMKKADKKEEKIANRILWIVITRLDGNTLGDDEILVDTPSEQSSIV
ncbi:hypothetical protein IWZ01DRAFT_508385 [Phyllosticta capitalensis]